MSLIYLKTNATAKKHIILLHSSLLLFYNVLFYNRNDKCWFPLIIPGICLSCLFNDTQFKYLICSVFTLFLFLFQNRWYFYFVYGFLLYSTYYGVCFLCLSLKANNLLFLQILENLSFILGYFVNINPEYYGIIALTFTAIEIINFVYLVYPTIEIRHAKEGNITYQVKENVDFLIDTENNIEKANEIKDCLTYYLENYIKYGDIITFDMGICMTILCCKLPYYFKLLYFFSILFPYKVSVYFILLFLIAFIFKQFLVAGIILLTIDFNNRINFDRYTIVKFLVVKTLINYLLIFFVKLIYY